MALTKVQGEGVGTLAGDTTTLTLEDTSSHSANTGPAISFKSKDSGGTTREVAKIVGESHSGSNEGNLAFQTRNGGTLETKWKVFKNGNMLPSNSAYGIYLGTTSVADSNLLDDYEEGTFTPGLIDSGGGLGANLTTAVGQYTKLGNKVHFQMRINGDARTSTSNQVYITNLPFTCSPASSVNRAQFEVNGINLGLDSGFYSLIGQLANTDTSITILMQGTSLDNFRGHDLTPSYEIYVHGAYFT